jgi:hypothetical protein
MGKRVTGAILLIALSGLLAWGTPARAFQETSGPLAQMLGQVGDNAASRSVMWYGSQADLERALGFQLNGLGDFQKLPKQQQAAYLMDVGKQVYYSPFSGTEQSTDWKKVFGVDPFAIERELTVGSEPDWYAVLRGRFAADAIIKALQNLGYKAAQVGRVTVYSLGADNASDPSNPANQLAQNVYNRLVVSDAQILAAPSTALIRSATDTGRSIGDNPDYAALANVLESQATVPNTQLLSAALFSGSFLSKTVTAGSQGAALLPRYDAAAIGYRRNATDRFLVIALAYGDADTANRASAILADQLAGYDSLQQPGRKLFDGWKISVTVTPSTDNTVQVATATLQLPAETDVAWIDLVQSRDIGFLAAQR